MNQQADIKIIRLFFKKDYNLIREQFVLGQVSYHVTKDRQAALERPMCHL